MGLAHCWCSPCPELTRDVTECPPRTPLRGFLQSRLSRLCTLALALWRAGLISSACSDSSRLGAHLAALRPACSSQRGLEPWDHHNQPAHPGGLQPRERVLPQPRRPEPEIQAEQGRAPSRGSRGGSLLPLPASGGPSVPRLGAASLSATCPRLASSLLRTLALGFDTIETRMISSHDP